MHKIENHPDLRRHGQISGIVINVNTEAYDARLKQLNHRREQDERIQRSEQEVEDLKMLVRQLIGDANG